MLASRSFGHAEVSQQLCGLFFSCAMQNPRDIRAGFPCYFLNLFLNSKKLIGQVGFVVKS
jgi:hypothetical protein